MTAIDTELRGLQIAIKKAANGELMVRRADVFAAMRRISARLAGPGQSVQQSLVKNFVESGSQGAEVYQRFATMTGPSFKNGDFQTTQAADLDDDAGADDRGDDAPSFSDLVDQHQAAHPKMSRSSSIDHCLATTQGRRAMAVEKSRRVGKAISYSGGKGPGSGGDGVGNARDRGELGEDGDTLDSMVAAHMRQFPGVSRATAMAHCMSTPAGSAAYRRGRDARLSRAVRV
jgi:hypothetical protein